jgi:hypothetical protein
MALKRMLTKFSLLPLLLLSVQLNAEQIVLDKHNFKHIHFKRIKPNIVTFSADTIHFEVDKSASFLLLAFDDIKSFRTVSFEWKANGTLNKRDIEHEQTRKGDDAWLRVGLIIEGQAEDLPEPLLPRWMKQVRKTLRYTSGSMIYLIPDARHAPGETWRSPFNSNVDMVSVGSITTYDEWKHVSHEFAQPQRTIGLWIMADGDNTGSTFNTQLRNLIIE